MDTKTTSISAERVEEILKDSLYTVSELDEHDKVLPADAVRVQSIMAHIVFNPKRLESHRAEVQAMIDALPDPFDEEIGQGWSFLNMPFEKSDDPDEDIGVQWGEQMNADQLLALALGLKLASFCLPRQFWSSLPGGLPYVVIKKTKEMK